MMLKKQKRFVLCGRIFRSIPFSFSSIRAIKKEKNVLTTCITEERNGQDLNSVLKSLGEISVVNKGPDPAGKQKSKKKKVNATAMSEDVQDVISEEKTDDKENESTSNVGVGDEFKQLEHSTKTFPKTSNASAAEGIDVEIEIEKVAGSVENWSTESAVTSVCDINQVPDSTGKNKSSRKMANATFVKEDSHDFVSEAMTDDREKETLSKVKELEDEIRLLNEKHNIFIEEKGKEMTKLLNIVDEKEDLIHKNGKKISSLKEEIRNLQKDSEEQGKAVLKADGKKKRLEEYMTKTTDEFKVNRDALNRKLWKFKDQVRNIQENNRTIQKESKKENSTEIPENPLLEVLNEHIASKTRDLECPVCMEVAKPPAPLFMCQDSHLICSECKPRLDKCPTCRLTYNDPVLKNRLAENSRDELTKLRKQRDKFLATL